MFLSIFPLAKLKSLIVKQLFIIFYSILLSSTFCIAQEGFVEKLPDTIKSYMQTYFPNQKVIKYKSEITSEIEKHKVFLDNGITIVFDEGFQPNLIYGTVALPDAVIPKKILSYVKGNFPNHPINRWQIRAINQTIQLDDGTNLKFDSKGNLVRMRKS